VRAFLFVIIAIAAVASVVSVSDQALQAAPPGPNSYYGDWQKHPHAPYYVRKYYFKQTADAPSYKYHECMWYPGGKYFYFYNPYSRKFWGRCSIYPDQQGQYFDLGSNSIVITTNNVTTINQVINVIGNDNNINFQGVQGGAFPTTMNTNAGADPANVPLVPPPDDAPLGTSFPSP
jgi:hypothetical protein